MLSWLRKNRIDNSKSPKPIESILNEGKDNTYTMSLGGNNRAWEHIVARGNIATVTDELGNDGFRRGIFIGSGDNAVIGLFNNGQCLRFRGAKGDDPSTWDPPDIDQMIGTFYNKEICGARIVGINFVRSMKVAVDTGELSRQDALILLTHLRVGIAKNNDGCMLTDWERSGIIKFEQIGLLPDNTPIVLDMGAVIPIKNIDSIFNEKRAAALHLEYTSILHTALPEIPPSLHWDGKWTTAEGIRKTESFFPQTKTKQVMGVVTAEDLQQFRKERNISVSGNTVFERAIEDNGLSMSEFGALVKKAGDNLRKKHRARILLKHIRGGKVPGLCQAIERERKKL